MKILHAIKLIGFSIAIMSLNAQTFAQTFVTYDMANTPVFTSNIFKAPIVDKDGVVYAGTANQGLYQFNKGVWKKLGVLTNNNISQLVLDQFNKVWIAQYGNTGAQAITGGVVVFSDSLLSNYTYYGALSPNNLPTRNVRGIFLDTFGYYSNNLDHVWTAHLGDITGGVSTISAVGMGLNNGAPYFSTQRNGVASSGSVQCVAGNDSEIWAFATNNISNKSQILRFNAINRSYIGYYNVDSLGLYNFTASSFGAAMLFASDGKQWIGLRNGQGLVVKSGSVWTTVDMLPFIFPSTTVNNNALYEDSKGRVYVGTTGGLLVYSGGQVDDVANWKKYTTTEGLPNDNVTGIAENRKTGEIVITTSGGISFLSEKNFAEMRWDESYLYQQGAKPKGVAADGVSRIKIRVYSPDGFPPLKSATIKIRPANGKARSLQGKVMKASKYGIGYSEEANSATALQVTYDTSLSATSLWFWYVSPDDFSVDSNSVESVLSERSDSIRVYVTFNNNAIDSCDLLVKIVRPPLVLVHGLASNPGDTWNTFAPLSNVPFISNPYFVQRNALKMNGAGSFDENALTLMEYLNPNSIPSCIISLRDKGYAASQVDYVCHSMGGLMLRFAVDAYNPIFYNHTRNERSNYGKGYVHKFITINSPHNGSPVADAITEYIPQMPPVLNNFFRGWYKINPNAQKPFNWFVPDDRNFIPLIGPFKATPAVKNLQVKASTGGIKLGTTPLKNHLITGNVEWNTVNSLASTLANIDPLLEVLDAALGSARDKAVLTSDKVFLTGLQGLTKAARALGFVDWYSTKLGYPNFLASGDLIVPLKSQLAQQSGTLPHITNKKNSPNSFGDAWHSKIVERNDVGQVVMNLLNSSVNSNLFANAIPANTDPEPPAQNGMQLYAPLPIVTQYGTSKVQITSPASNAGDVFADSTLNITISLKDTQGFAYMKVFFQDKDSSTISTNASQTFSFKISPEFPDSQAIVVMAVYDKPTQIEYHVDTTIKIVKNKAVPTGIQFKNDSLQITAGIPEFPALQIQYSGKWVALPANAAGLVLSSKDSSIMTFDQNKALKGVAPGSTKLYASYLGFKDTVGVNCSPALLSSSVIKSIGSGKFSSGTTWNRSGGIPTILDSVVIKAGHIVTLDTIIRVRAIYVEPGGNLQFKGKAGDSLKIGEYNFKDGLGFSYPPVWKSSNFDLQQSLFHKDLPTIAFHISSQVGKQAGCKKEKISFKSWHTAFQNFEYLPELDEFKQLNRLLINDKISC